MKCAIYVRVSTKDKGQDVANQLIQLRAWCREAGHTIFEEYRDYETGSHGNRQAFRRMWKDAAARRFNMILVWAVDRFSREGPTTMCHYLHLLELYNIWFRSFTEPNLSIENEMMRTILTAVYADQAKSERRRISERTLAGLQRVREQGSKSGKPIGHPYLAKIDRAAVRAAQGSQREIAKRFGISKGTVQNIKREA